jgi:rhomboid family GlyGly-CTERM serine protease
MADRRPVGRFKFGLASLNCDGWRGVALLAICALFEVLAYLGFPAVAALQYDRTAIAGGEWWRLVTAHVVHLGLLHGALNIAGLTLIWVLFAREYSAGRWAVIILASIAAIDAGLWLRDPEIDWYVGASGVLHGALAAGVVARMHRRDPDGWLLAAFLAAKLSYEQFAGAMPFSAGIGPVIVNAHLYGAAGALVAALPQPGRRSL